MMRYFIYEEKLYHLDTLFINDNDPNYYACINIYHTEPIDFKVDKEIEISANFNLNSVIYDICIVNRVNGFTTLTLKYKVTNSHFKNKLRSYKIKDILC